MIDRCKVEIIDEWDEVGENEIHEGVSLFLDFLSSWSHDRIIQKRRIDDRIKLRVVRSY